MGEWIVVGVIAAFIVGLPMVAIFMVVVKAMNKELIAEFNDTLVCHYNDNENRDMKFLEGYIDLQIQEIKANVCMTCAAYSDLYVVKAKMQDVKYELQLSEKELKRVSYENYNLVSAVRKAEKKDE